jgi:hypothetical protein
LNSLLLRGDKSGRFITDVTLKGPDPNAPDQPLGARKPSAVILNFPDTNNLGPDHYGGTINFGLAGSEVQPTVNYSVDVRDAAWWALLVLFLGVVVGRLVKSMNSPEAITQLKLMERLIRLQSSATSLPDGPDRAALRAELDAMKQRINAANETEAALTTELDKIETRINMFIGIERLRLRIVTSALNATLKQELDVKLQTARQLLRQGRIEDCTALIKEIEAQLLEALASPLEGDGENFPGMLNSVRDLNEAGVMAFQAHMVAPPPTPGRLARILGGLSGVNILTAEVRFPGSATFVLSAAAFPARDGRS